MNGPRKRFPAWVWAIAVVIALIEPATHVWIAYFPPAGAAPTGLHITDSAIFLQAMDMLPSGFYSPYASCQSPYGIHSWRYFIIPFHWLYGLAGALGHLLHVNRFLWLGAINGMGVFAYLVTTYWFLREFVPRYANRAYLLFTLGGGLAGLLYVVTGLVGLHSAPHFEEYFRRFALYELIEGPTLAPALLAPRLYYTLPLACCLAAAVLLRRALSAQGLPRWGLLTVLMATGSLINMRVGAMVWGVLLLYLTCESRFDARQRVQALVAFALPLVAAIGLNAVSMALHPSYAHDTAEAAQHHMWLSPFLSAVVLFLFVVPAESWRHIHALSGWQRRAAFSLTGYLVAFTVLFALYQVYYGNILVARDAAVAVAVSDWALLGALLGAVLAELLRKAPASGDRELDWVVLWLLLFAAVSLSAVGHGWFLRFAPQRAMVLLYLPLCILASAGLHRMAQGHAGAARVLTTAIVACGVLSIAVASLCFQGPLGHRPGSGPFAEKHCAVMLPADADVLRRVHDGIVLAPATPGPYFGDVCAQRYGLRTVFGKGTHDFSELSILDMQRKVEHFFAPDATNADRQAFARTWCADYVYLPATHPVPAETLAALRGAPWLLEVLQEQDAHLFRVMPIE